MWGITCIFPISSLPSQRFIKVHTGMESSRGRGHGYADMMAGGAKSQEEEPHGEKWLKENDTKLLSLKLRQQKLRELREKFADPEVTGHHPDGMGVSKQRQKSPPVAYRSSSPNRAVNRKGNDASDRTEAANGGCLPQHSPIFPTSRNGLYPQHRSRSKSPVNTRSTSPSGDVVTKFNPHPNPEMDARHHAKEDAVLNARFRNQLRQTQQRLDEANAELRRLTQGSSRGRSAGSSLDHGSHHSPQRLVDEVKRVMADRDEAKDHHRQLSLHLEEINEQIVREDSQIDRIKTQRNSSQQRLFALQKEHSVLRKILDGGGGAGVVETVFPWSPAEEAKRKSISKNANEVEVRIGRLLGNLEELEAERDAQLADRSRIEQAIAFSRRRLEDQLQPTLARQEAEQRELLLEVKAEAIAVAQADLGITAAPPACSTRSPASGLTQYRNVNGGENDTSSSDVLQRLLDHRKMLARWARAAGVQLPAHQ